MLIARLLQDVSSDLPLSQPFRLCRGELVEVERNQHGAVSVKCRDGNLLGLKPGEYVIVCEKMMGDDKRQIKSYVWQRESGRCFFVSTIERESSADVEPPSRWYMETIVWGYDWDARERGAMLAMAGSGPALEQHFEVCRQLYETGEYVEEEP